MNRNRLWTAGVILFSFVLMAGCGPEDIDKGDPFELMSLSVTPVNISIAPETGVQYTAIGTYSNNTTRNISASVTWESPIPALRPSAT